jgi:FkbM family methyltransferase
MSAYHALRRRLREKVDTTRLRRALAPTGSAETVYLGSRYGGWFVPMNRIDASSIVYSGGVGEDVTFDLALIETIGCHVWAFDPTPRAVTFARSVTESRFHFEPVGLWEEDGVRRFWAPRDPAHVSHSTVRQAHIGYFDAECLSLPSIVHRLGHDRIDLLKLDIEGAEFSVLASLEKILPRCICVEVHPVRPLDEIVSFVRGLPYEVIRVHGWNLTLLRAD